MEKIVEFYILMEKYYNFLMWYSILTLLTCINFIAAITMEIFEIKFSYFSFYCDFSFTIMIMCTFSQLLLTFVDRKYIQKINLDKFRNKLLVFEIVEEKMKEQKVRYIGLIPNWVPEKAATGKGE